ncbi:filamentous hemagglutinin N-terminal domain-containing protein [Pseudomonas sp. HR96]|uniref:two-partner secretion domain-containing protein n=1 Tax=Pseudomonas sp. HR96 TaxID=1027966 RepID=UPI002A7643E8|nr:filamentous hemagglutinin N-terminal domain-containing protein [Pseudomonas sp. HR96]WPO98276.1 filamentous hemagglutinin N-terminal domain-containing protein [Pseudomonas sp. HR96]
MDVRQLALLARQPSARLQPREHFWGLPKRGLALILANALFWQPLWAQAGGVVVSGPGTTLGSAGNGVPIVNIAAPNAAGLSHNQYSDYNVGSNGLILNNANGSTQSTQLGGIIVGNPNLKGQAAASTIVNEVTGNNRSQLNGYTEVAGQAAHVIVANPYGITCNGCGFINTPRATLTTGKTVLDAAGRLDHYQVDGGDVAIEGAGINAGNVDSFEVITRSARINAQINANRLSVVAGRNDVDASSLQATPRADDGSAKPTLAIDSTALGGMYAGAIKLVGTEAGVGVKVAGNLAASAGDIQLDANGHLEVAQAAASGAVRITAQSVTTQGPVYAGSQLAVTTRGDLANSQNLAARDSITLSAGGQLSNSGIIEAGVNADNSRNASGDVSLAAQTLSNTASVIASRKLNTQVTHTLSNHGGTLSARQQLQVTADTLDNRNGGRVLSTGALGINANQLLNAQGGLITSNGTLTAQAGYVNNNAGELSSQADVGLALGSLDGVAGLVSAGGGLSITASGVVNNQGGRLAAQGPLSVASANLINRGGMISGAANVALSGQQLDNSQNGKVLAGTALALTVAQVNNQAGGLLSSDGVLSVNTGVFDNSAGTVTSAGPLSVVLPGALLNVGGSITTDQGLTLSTGSLDNQQQGHLSGKGATQVTTGRFDNGQGGSLTSGSTLNLFAGQVNNGSAGRIASDGALTASVTGLDQQGGQLFSNASLSLDLNHGLLNNSGLINAPGALRLDNLGVVLNHNGEISSSQAFALAAQSMDNSGGKVISDSDLTLQVAQSLNNSSGLLSGATLSSRSDNLDNTSGSLNSLGATDLGIARAFTNQGGTLVSNGGLQLDAATLDNSNGSISAKSDIQATVASLINHNGQLIASGGMHWQGTSLDNRQNGLIGAVNGLAVTVDSVDNRGGELSSNTDLHMHSHTLDNSDGGLVIASQGLQLNVDQALNRNAGQLTGKASLELTGQSLDNSGGTLSSLRDLQVSLTGDLQNSQGLLSSEGTLGLNAASLANRQGSLSSAGPLRVATTGAVDNQGGQLVTDADLDLHSLSLDNSHAGRLSARGPMSLSTGTLDNSQNGNISSSDALDLSAGQVNNNIGQIASQNALVATVTGLDQAGGKLFSNTALSLDLDHGQLDNPNGLINAPVLVLNHLGGVNNASGEISSAQGFTFSAASLTNDNGKLLSNQALTVWVNQAISNLNGTIAAAALQVQAGSFANTGGTLNSRGDLGLSVGGALINNSQGLINASGNLAINAISLDNSNGGNLLGSGIALDFGAATGDLNNSNGLISTQGQLTLNHLRDLDNQHGVLSSTQRLNLVARDIDNSAGQLVSDNLLTLAVTRLVNPAGLVSGWQGVTISASSLDNHGSGTVSSRYGNVTVSVDGDLLNGSNGALVSQGALTVTANDLDNSAGILSSGTGQTLTVANLLNNGQGGLIDSGANLTLHALDLSNVAGTLTAQQAFNFTGATLDNTGGSVAANGAGTLNLLGVLTNSSGKLATGAALLIQGATQINNHNGQLASQNLLTLLTGGLDNSQGGTVAANGLLAINATGLVQNGGDGLIYSQNAGVQLQAASLDNSHGTLQSQGALTVAANGDIDNQSGTVLAQTGALTINAANLDSRGGTLASLQSAFSAHLTGVLKNGYDLSNNNRKGNLQARSLDLSSTALDNDGGRIAATTGDAVIHTGDFNNQNGGLYAAGKVSVSAHDFDNSGSADGQIGGQQIDLSLGGALNNENGLVESTSSLSISAASVDNQTGKLRALGSTDTTQLQIAGLFDNRNGTLETANSNLALSAGNLLNAGGSVLHVGTGTFGLSTANVMNAGGSLVTRGALTLNADSWTNSSVIQAGSLNVNVNQFTQTDSGQLLTASTFIGTGTNWVNNGLIASDGTANLNLTGTYSGNGRVTSLGPLGLTANQLALGSAASVAGGARTDINIAGQLSNAGRLTSSSDLFVNAGSVSNSGTLGAGRNFTLSASTLTNNQGLLFSGADTQLNVGSFTNQGGNLYALGAVAIGGYAGAARSAAVYNISGSMQSGGTFALNADVFENRTQGGQTGGDMQLLSGYIADICNDCKGDNYTITFAAVEDFQSTDNDTSASSQLSAGTDFTFKGGSFLNSKSTIAAGGSINIQADTVQNVGSTSGTVERTRTWLLRDLDHDYAGGLMAGVVVPYNQRNNPDFPYTYYLDLDGGIHKALAKSVRYKDGGRDGAIHEVVSLVNSDTGGSVVTQGDYNIVLTGLGYKFENSVTSQYDPNNLLQVPTELSQYTPVSDVEVVKDNTGAASTGTIRNAVIQAAGSVSISASENLQNSVIHEGLAYNTGTNISTDTHASGSGKTVVVRLNSQLPPDLAQQQVDPLTLPGFSLPTGQNGLFRLSGQGVSGSASGSVAQNWTLSSGQLTGATLLQNVPVAQARTLLAGSAGQTTASDTRLGAIAPSAAGNAAGNFVQTSVVGQTLARVQGLPDSSSQSQPQKYLVETNPVLTNLKQFMSSDYMLSALGYNPDASEKRLGDGLYEQTLINQAITARTGQHYIDGETSDAAQFKYLMDNGIAAQQQLNLTVGTALSAEQVAALTHDIVWMQSEVVDGQTVLVPVVYLAQASGRLGPTGALIAGSDVNLAAGQSLTNTGTLSASNNLTASAGTDLTNSGLISAGNRLSVLAGDSVTNQAGGIIAGRDVSVSTATGDVINNRSLTALDSTLAGTLHKDTADSAARIEAANDLTVSAGRDIANTGSVLQSGRDLTLTAGRDIDLSSAQLSNSLYYDARHNQSDVTQLTGTVSSGRDLSAQSGRDINIIASQISAQRDVALSATENLTVSSAADETHSLSRSKKLTTEEDHVSQVQSSIAAVGNVGLSAGQDLALVSSKVEAGGDAYLVAGGKLDVLAAQNTDYSLYDKNKKGSFGAKQTKHDEVTQDTNVGSQITSGSDTVLVSGGDQHYQAAKLDSGNNLTISSGGLVDFEGVKDLHQETHSKSNTSLAWNSMSGKGSTDETLQQTQMIAKGKTVISAVNGLNIDVKQVNQETVSQVVDTMVQVDPSLSWLKDAEARGDVNWQRVQEIHDSYKYSNSGLGTGAQLALAIVIAAFTGGAGASLVGASGGTFLAGFANAAVVSLEVSAANSAISNRGDPVATVKDTLNKASLEGAAISGLTAGFINYASSSWFGGSVDSVTGKVTGAGLVPSFADPASLARFSAIQLASGAVNGALSTATGTGSFKDAMLGSVFTVLEASAFNAAGDLGQKLNLDDGSLGKIAIHAIVGGVLSEAMGGDFKTGAIAAGANEALVDYLDKSDFLKGGSDSEHQRLVNAASKLVGLITAAADGGNLAVASEITGNAQSYNRQLHVIEQKMLQDSASKLDQSGPSRSSLPWETLLAYEAGASVDDADAAELKSILGNVNDTNPEKANLLDDLQKANDVITGIKNEKIALTWEDGTPIIAHGDPVYAFTSSDAQAADGTLFNTSAGYSAYTSDGTPSLSIDWVKQFGADAAWQHQGEIGNIATSKDSDQYQRLSTALGGGVVPVAPELDLALAFAGGGIGGNIAKALLEVFGAKRAASLVGRETAEISGAKGIDNIFASGRTPKASELKEYAEAQGWKPSQTDGGPLKYVDESGIPRVTIKQGSSRAPGSSDPHVEFKDATGQRTDAFGNPVTRKSPDNHTSIDFDL